MDLYTDTCYRIASLITNQYSTSFSMSSRRFSKKIRHHIYAVYGIVRLADEIVDTYKGSQASKQLDSLRDDVHNALNNHFSVNPIVHAFATTANLYNIGPCLIDPFFDSMAVDLSKNRFTASEYNRYIYGSAEVVGLMCLKIFTNNNSEQYESLAPGARALGSAYQKINFLRDFKADYEQLERIYFPGVEYATFTNSQKAEIVSNIKQDISLAESALIHLPVSARLATTMSFRYYNALLHKLNKASVDEIKQSRIRISDSYKIWLYLTTRGIK